MLAEMEMGDAVAYQALVPRTRRWVVVVVVDVVSSLGRSFGGKGKVWTCRAATKTRPWDFNERKCRRG